MDRFRCGHLQWGSLEVFADAHISVVSFSRQDMKTVLAQRLNVTFRNYLASPAKRDAKPTRTASLHGSGVTSLGQIPVSRAWSKLLEHCEEAIKRQANV